MVTHGHTAGHTVWKTLGRCHRVPTQSRPCLTAFRSRMNFSCMRAPSVLLRGTTAVRAERTTSLPRGSVVRRCSPGNAPLSDQQLSRAAAKPLKPGLVSIAGDLHLHIDAINVHISSSNPPPASQQDVASMLQSAVPDTITAAVTATRLPTPTPTPTPAPTPAPTPFSCIGTMDLSQYKGHTWAMCSDGHSFICVQDSCEGYPNNVVALWDVRNPAQRVVPVLSDNGTVRSVAVSEDGSRILLACKNGLWLWDTWQGRDARLLPTIPEITGDGESEDADKGSVAITPDGRFAVAGGYGMKLQVWDLQTETCIANAGTDGIVTAVAIAPDGRTATALVDTLVAASDDSNCENVTSAFLWEWGAESGFAPPLQLPGTMWPDPWGAFSAMSADGSRGTVVLTLQWDAGVVHQWDSQSGKPTVVSLEAGQVYSVALSADGRRAVLGYGSGLVRVWDVQGDTCLATLNHGDEVVTRVAISADGRHAVSHSYDDGRTCVWHLG